MLVIKRRRPIPLTPALSSQGRGSSLRNPVEQGRASAEPDARVAASRSWSVRQSFSLRSARAAVSGDLRLHRESF